MSGSGGGGGGGGGGGREKGREEEGREEMREVKPENKMKMSKCPLGYNTPTYSLYEEPSDIFPFSSFAKPLVWYVARSIIDGLGTSPGKAVGLVLAVSPKDTVSVCCSTSSTLETTKLRSGGGMTWCGCGGGA